MAYTTAQLVDAYTKANLGKAPDQATSLTLDAYATQTLPGGSKTDAQALADTLKLVNPTTAVAVETYQFFTGRAPTTAGLTYLVNSATNTTDLNDAYYAKFSQENRFINFSINLATGQGEGATAFAQAYGGTSVSYQQVVASAYDKVIGNAAAAAAGVDVTAAVTFLSRQANIDYLTAFVKANTGYTSASDIDLAVKAALIGEVLNAATVSGIGIYARATNALLVDLSDGVLSAETTNGTNILTAYPGAGIPGQSFTLTAAVDTLTGTTGDDTFTATGTTLTALDSISGGAGTDTLVLQDAAASLAGGLAAGLTITGIEKFNVTTAGALGAVGSAAVPAVAAVKQVDTIAIVVNNASTVETFTVQYNGVTVTTAGQDGVAVAAADIAQTIASAINGIAGSTVATVAGDSVVLTAPVAGVPLPGYLITPSAPLDATLTQTTQVNNVAGSAAVAAISAALFDVSGFTGLTDLTASAVGTASIKAQDSTNVTLTDASAGAISIVGGKAVTVVSAGGAVVIDGGNGLASVNVSGAAAVTVDDNVAGTSAGTLTTATINKIGGAVSLTGDALTSLALTGANAATQTVVVNNTTASHALAITAGGAGRTAASGNATVTVQDNVATSVSFNTTSRSNLALTAGLATAITATGSARLDLNLAGAGAVTSFDGSASTGAFVLTNLNSGLASIKTGAGADVFTLTATAAATVATGDGADTVTLGSTLAAGSTVNLGAGNDKLLGTAEIAASTVSATTVVDGGDGVDTLAAGLVNAGNAAQFKNFEILGLNNGSTFDLALLTGSTITGLELFGATTSAQYNNVALTQGLTVSADTGAGAFTTTLSFAGATGGSDAYTVTFAAAGSSDPTTPTTVRANTVNVSAVEALTIASGSSTGTTANSITVADTTLKTIAITGTQALTLGFTGVVGATGTGNGVSSIDASANTGGVTIDMTTAGTLNLASAGLTIKGSAGKDVITLSSAATVDLGAGDDKVVSAAAGGTFTGGAGKDFFDIKATVSAAATPITAAAVTITDLGAGDTIGFKVGAVSTAFQTTAVNIGNANDFTAALNAAATAASGDANNSKVVWFQYAGNTYLFEDAASTGLNNGGDILVKLTGLVDLSHSTIASATGILTFA